MPRTPLDGRALRRVYTPRPPLFTSCARHLAKVPCRWNVLSVKCLLRDSEMACQWNVLSVKCLLHDSEMACRWNEMACQPVKCLVGKKQFLLLVKCLVEIFLAGWMSCMWNVLFFSYSRDFFFTLYTFSYSTRVPKMAFREIGLLLTILIFAAEGKPFRFGNCSKYIGGLHSILKGWIHF